MNTPSPEPGEGFDGGTVRTAIVITGPTALLSIGLLTLGGLLANNWVIGAGIGLAAASAILWTFLRAYWARRFRHSEQSSNDLREVARLGLDSSYFRWILIISAFSAITIYAATRSSGWAALSLGIAAMFLGFATAVIRLRGYQQRLSGPPNDLAITTEHPQWQRVSQQTANQAVDRMIRILADVCVAIALLATLLLSTSALLVQAPLAIAVLVAAIIAHVTTKRPSRQLSYLAIAVLALLFVGTAAHYGSISNESSSLILTWVAVACIVAPLAVPAGAVTTAMVAVAGTTVISMTLLWQATRPTGVSDGLVPHGTDWLLIPAAGLCVGMVSVVVTSTFHLVANVHDNATVTAWNRLQEALARSGFEAAMFETSRTLHDTLINTLGALRAGIVDSQRVRDRLREDLQLVQAELAQEEAAEESSLIAMSEVLATLPQRAQTLDVRIEITADDAARTTWLDSKRANAIAGATREALTNISKHTTSRCAEITLRSIRRKSGYDLVLRITSANEAAFDLPDTGGLRQSIIERCHRAGVRATAQVADDHTTIEISWPATSHPTEPASSEPFSTASYLQSVTVATSRSISFWPIGYCILLSAVWIGFYDWSWWLLGVLIVVGSTMAAINYLALQRPPQTLRFAILATVPLALLWQTFGNPAYQGDSVTSPMGMSYVGAATVAITWISLDRARGAWLLGVAGYWGGSLILTILLLQIHGFSLVPVTVAALFTVAAGMVAMGRVQLHTLAERTERTASEFAAQQSRTIVAREAERARSRVMRNVLSEHWEFLEQLADGTIQPDNPQTMRDIVEVERLLRSYVHIGSEPGPLTDQLLELMATARSNQVEVDVVAVDNQPGIDLTDAPRLNDICLALFAEPPPSGTGGKLSVSTYRARQGCGITLVLDQPIEVPASLTASESSPNLEWITTADQTFIEINYPLSDGIGHSR